MGRLSVKIISVEGNLVAKEETVGPTNGADHNRIVKNYRRLKLQLVRKEQHKMALNATEVIVVELLLFDSRIDILIQDTINA